MATSHLSQYARLLRALPQQVEDQIAARPSTKPALDLSYWQGKGGDYILRAVALAELQRPDALAFTTEVERWAEQEGPWWVFLNAANFGQGNSSGLPGLSDPADFADACNRLADYLLQFERAWPIRFWHGLSPFRKVVYLAICVLGSLASILSLVLWLIHEN